MKKVISLTLALLFLSFNMPYGASYAIEENNKKASKKELKLEAERQKNAIDFINLSWWQDFDDEYLESYILQAIQNNQDLKIATLKVEEARQMVKIQFANELPSVAAGASPNMIKMPSSTSTNGLFALPIIASYEVDIFLKNRDKTNSVKKMYEASQLSEQASYLGIASAIGSVYYNIVKLDKMIEIQKEIISERKEIYDLMKQSNEMGIISTSDLMKANKAYVLAQSNIHDLEKGRDIALNQLAVLIGDSPNNSKTYKRISYDNLLKQKSIPDSIPSEIITNRPDYKIAEKMIEKAKIDVRVAKKEFLPTIDIIGLMTFLSGSASTFSWENSLLALGGAALLPLFTGGKRIANLKINKNKYEQILEDYYKTNLTAMQEVNNSLSSLKYDNSKYKTNLDTLKLEEKDFKYTQDKYDAGVISRLDLIQQKENLHTIEKLVVSNKIECYIDQIGLYKATAAQNL